MAIAREQIEKRVAAFVTACRSQGIKATHQRTEILRELAGSEEHPDAETVYARVRRRIPAISLDTVYRTLRLFEEKTIVARVGSLKDRARFDANNDRHHHFVCTRCGLVRDFYADDFDGFRPPAEVARLGKVASLHVELRGLCRQCQAKRR
jgi:Fur family peroxide stress response transcriptional regulator